MKIIKAEKIIKVVADLCLKANYVLRRDILHKLKLVYSQEKNSRARKALGAIIENARIAAKEKLAICQDTGLPIVFIELGQDIRITGDLKKAVLKGIEQGYKKGNFRESIINDPIARGKSGYRGAVIHTDIVKGDKLKITVLPKGFGCENKSQFKMLNPTAGEDEVKKFIIQAVKTAGPDACPPYVVGVGIGGSSDYAGFLAKVALLKNINAKRSKLEQDLEKEIGKSGIGPMGLGGKVTCLAVKIESFPTHIAGLPVAVNISCHALRSASARL
ncbi:MAG: fumarate hydratase [Candidatus Omnitrophica bacterium]|jgi:fumarate hydratase subunit alpha|nr:fumarate hydratase [Candidatus Omnitrophota bacterium]MDD5518741.1 fumarate hydratase [Candidatus Omnitrophota bacterium]